MRNCPKCGNEVDDKAILCVSCGTPLKVKKPIFKKWWFWVIIVIVVIAITSATGGSDTNSNLDNNTITQSQTNTKSDISYEVVDLQTMLDELSENAMKAENTYQDKYVEITGQISNFDSDGGYISIEPVNADEWNFDTVMCYIENEEQKQVLMEKSKGDTVIVKGQITSVGEVLGYSIEMDSIA